MLLASIPQDYTVFIHLTDAAGDFVGQSDAQPRNGAYPTGLWLPGEVIHECISIVTDGTPVEIYTLRNGNGMEARICTFGGIVVSLTAPDRSGAFSETRLAVDREGIAQFNLFSARLPDLARHIAAGTPAA